ncbi:tRNA-2-methylthio-N(6)-dimethylallyladenosine synthase [mine drainage metagenome]|uniref:tRNA-2-methylthio-N(6)-dimethylallyladenosine synthase n=1 Tax=mine drainage metagenome TaxID=410659 RepID=A0A1J5QPK6_9ZZZZ
MILSDRINTYGQHLLRRYGMRVHKIALDAGFTCPNRDGTKGAGGCTFCSNVSFSPVAGSGLDVPGQIAKARAAIAKRTRARHFIAYFQAYTNTYADIAQLEALYREALAQPNVIGISVGTRPDCVSPAVLDLLDRLRGEDLEVWLELGLQSAFDATLERVNRGHTLAEYRDTALAARARGIPLCTHLIIGLPGEGEHHYHATLDTVLDIGVDGLKLHPLHVVKHTMLAYQWRRGGYQPLVQQDYVRIAADLIERTPSDIIYHRVTATASKDILLAPTWCSQKWNVLNGIERELRRRGTRQGGRAGAPHVIEELQHVA